MTDAPNETPIATMQKRLERVRLYCRERGIADATLASRALANSRGIERLGRKIERLEEDLSRLEQYIALNPPGATRLVEDKQPTADCP